MTPRLVLLTWPAAGEVARVFRDGADVTKRRDVLPGPLWLPAWDEVRDYMDAPDHVAVTMAGRRSWMRDSLPSEAEAAIRSLPGGEAWLVGLVLPEVPGSIEGGIWPWHEAVKRNGQPRRLAILAPEPPTLLVERVKAWGGEAWECYVSETGSHVIMTERFHGNDIGSGVLVSEDTWPAAVRAALGEVAP